MNDRCRIVYGGQQTIDVAGRAECGGTYSRATLFGFAETNTGAHPTTVTGAHRRILVACDRCGTVRLTEPEPKR